MLPQPAGPESSENLLQTRTLHPHPKPLCPSRFDREAASVTRVVCCLHYTERQLEAGLRGRAGRLCKRKSSGQAIERGGREQAGGPWPRPKRRARRPLSLCFFVFFFPRFSSCLSVSRRSKCPLKAFQLIRPGSPKIITLIKINK